MSWVIVNTGWLVIHPSIPNPLEYSTIKNGSSGVLLDAIESSFLLFVDTPLLYDPLTIILQ